ncbi:MAG: tRNA preQ1(34) S-adenosylmethionine ribosyltransferase-isomerase QueA [Cyanobacteria bacterium SBC]|nr:tRNA preQ1(34) S-adenosylmethionine ribosyltransferase-isomerase QueA [Cyanobacteria bacterium SBC]
MFPPSPSSSSDFSIDAYDYELPEERIAQNPVEPRDSARLLVLESPTTHSHQIFRDLPAFLKPGDLLVLNDTRVLPARLYGQKPSGAAVEVLLLEEVGNRRWLALVKPGKRLKPGAEIIFLPNSQVGNGQMGEFRARVVASDDDTGGRVLEFQLPTSENFSDVLERYGHVPLPPYVTQSQADPRQYQTVYAREARSAAAPTAGLHFTEALLEQLADRGIDRAFVTLHVGVGTFRPVEVSDITQHTMHEEWVSVPEATVAAIRETRQRGGRVIAVGTTAVRSLESAALDGSIEPFCGKTDLFIYPGYHWRVIDGLITNFHLPKSSLLMLVSALVGRKRLLQLYQEAILNEYRFFSFGDAMLVLPTAKVEDL